jgi:hypothetical protein
MQSVALGGGVVLLVGVGVADFVGVGVAVGVGVGVGVLFVPPGRTAGLVPPPLLGTFPEEPGFGVLLALELGVTLPPPGEGFGVGAAGVDGNGFELGKVDDDAVAAVVACGPEWRAVGPEEIGRAAASSSIGRRAA